MDCLDGQDGKRMLSSSSFKSDAIGNESVHYEKFLLDDLDNYWDELNDRLTVTRMVNDSVIKGIVNALIAESKENITLKDVEIETLNKKLQSLHNISPSKHSTTYGYLNCNNIDNICRLRLVAEDHIRKLKENIPNAHMGISGMLSEEMKNEKLIEANKSVNSLGTIVESLFKEIDEMHEIQLQAKVERELHLIILGSSVETLQNKFEKKLYEQISLNKRLYMDRQQKANELSKVRDHLNSLSSTLSNTLSNTESKLLLSHNSLDSFEEWNTPKRKELVTRKLSGGHHKEENGILSKNIKLDVPDASQLKHLNRDELIDYYKNEMINMRRQHESALQEKTEEIFKLKREFLRQKGSSPFKRDHEILRKSIPEIILKLNDIILEKETMPVVQIDEDELCILRNNIGKLHSENEKLKSIFAEKNIDSGLTLLSQASDIDKLHSENEILKIKHAKENKETESLTLSSQASDVESQILLRSSLETKFLQQIKMLEKDVREIEMESHIRDMVRSVIVKEVICENKHVVDDLEIETRIVQDVIDIVINGYTHDVVATINSIILRDCTEKSDIEALLREKEKALNIEIEKNMKLEEKIASLSTLTEDEEKQASQSEHLNQLIKKVYDMETETQIMQDFINIVVNGYAHDVISTINTIILRDCTEKSHLVALLCEKEKALNIEIEKNKKLEEKIASLSTLTKDDEKHVSQSEQLNQLLKGIEMLKEQVAKQEILISNQEAEKDLLKNEINDALQQLHQYDSNFIKLNGELANVSNALVEAEKQISLLQGIIEDNQKKLSSFISNDKQQAKQSEFIVKSITVLLEASTNFEHKVAEKIQRNESRLNALNRQCRSLVQQENKFPNRELLYKQMLDIKSSNLQKAEAEVDLLGDEVDTLLTFLGKIYIALDHYSPVLKHYPGVMETLKLVRRELGEPEDSLNRKTERSKRAMKSVSKLR